MINSKERTKRTLKSLQLRNINFKPTPSSNKNPHDISPIQNMKLFTASSITRSSDMSSNKKYISESLSSGFGSAQEIIETEYDLFTNMSSNVPTYQNLIPQPEKISKISENIYGSNKKRECLSPSNLMSFNTDKTERGDKIIFNKEFCEPKNTFDTIWDIEKDENLQNMNFNFQDNIFNVEDLFATQHLHSNLEEANNINYNFDLNNSAVNRSISMDGQNILNSTQSFFTQAIDQQMNQLPFMPVDNYNEINLINNQNFNQNNLHDPQIIINDSYNDNQNKQYSNSVPLSGINSSQNQNIIVRIIQNGQIQFAAVDPNLFQQIMMGNVRQNLTVIPNVTEMNTQIPRNNLDGASNIIYTNDNRNTSNIQKIAEPVDLMENPANWRRIPNNGGYQCNICNKCYTRKYGLKIHLRIHSGFKPLECK
ncbi:hypothetical protein MXB_5564, partial [Myxobolus squamalis]